MRVWPTDSVVSRSNPYTRVKPEHNTWIEDQSSSKRPKNKLFSRVVFPLRGHTNNARQNCTAGHEHHTRKPAGKRSLPITAKNKQRPRFDRIFGEDTFKPRTRQFSFVSLGKNHRARLSWSRDRSETQGASNTSKGGAQQGSSNDPRTEQTRRGLWRDREQMSVLLTARRAASERVESEVRLEAGGT